MKKRNINKKLTLKEKEIIKAFVFGMNKSLEGFQGCTTYRSFIDMNNTMLGKMNSSKAMTNFGELQSKIKMEMNESE